MIRFIKQVEAAKGPRHPVGMTAQWPQGNSLVESPADWISPPDRFPIADGRKVVLNDTDHSYFWVQLKADGIAAQGAWVWKNFTSGNQCLFMDPYLDPDHDPGRNHPEGGRPDPYWDELRQALGQTRTCAAMVDLASMVPHPELASTRWCLADPGREYLAYLPNEGDVEIDLTTATGSFRVEWMRPSRGSFLVDRPVSGGARRSVRAPFRGDAVVHLQRL
jgi:hypothetical protein